MPTSSPGSTNVKEVWVSAYHNADGDSDVIGVSDSCTVVDQYTLKKIESFIKGQEDTLDWERKSTKTKITYTVGYKQECVNGDTFIDTVEWYEIKKYPILTPKQAKR